MNATNAQACVHACKTAHVSIHMFLHRSRASRLKSNLAMHAYPCCLRTITLSSFLCMRSFGCTKTKMLQWQMYQYDIYTAVS